MIAANSYVGQPIERIEDFRLLRGQGQFVDDLHLDGMLHAAILRSSIPHGCIVRTDRAAALALPGAIVQGLGSTFLEHLVYDRDGQLLTGSLADYLLPTATDYLNVRVYDQEEYPSPNNPLGAKGAGEGGIIPVGGVIANAIASALGVQPRSLPMSPSRVWELINP
jgi:CO/xanthine dehydrogenase Mo-binding subunit